MNRHHDRDAAHLYDMLKAANECLIMLKDQDFESFSDNRILQLALERSLEIIGEAARRISIETRRESKRIPWHNIIGLRNLLAHEYGHIDHELLFETATTDIPELIGELARLLPADGDTA